MVEKAKKRTLSDILLSKHFHLYILGKIRQESEEEAKYVVLEKLQWKLEKQSWKELQSQRFVHK